METYIAPIIVVVFILVLRFTKIKLYIKESIVIQTIILLFLISLFVWSLIDYKNAFFYNVKTGILLIVIIITAINYYKKVKNKLEELNNN